MDGLPGGVTVTRIGTQVVVRLSGQVDDGMSQVLQDAVQEVATQVITRVVVDLAEVTCVQGAGIDFIAELNRRWQLRLINRPGGLGVRLLEGQVQRQVEGR